MLRCALVGFAFGQSVGLIAYEQARYAIELELGQQLERRGDVLFDVGIGHIDHVQQQIGILRFFERRAKRGEQLARQVADEAHRVGDDDLALARKAQPP